MSTSALVMMLVAWLYILFMVVYFFAKIVRKEHENRKKSLKIAPEHASPDKNSEEREEQISA